MGLMEHTRTTLKTSSVYLIIMDVGQLSDVEDDACLKLIHEGDKGLSRFWVYVQQITRELQRLNHGRLT